MLLIIIDQPPQFTLLHPQTIHSNMSPVHVDTDSSDSITPPNNSDGVISTGDCDMFDLANTDSDQEIEGEAETIALVGDYINRSKIACQNERESLFSLSQLMFTILLGMNIHLSPVVITV